jgi:hypothetical protein
MTDRTTVTQADREAAFAVARFFLGNDDTFPKQLRSGLVERHFLLDAFARHRIESQSSPTADDAALKYATSLALILRDKHFPEATQWKPLPDLIGVLTQIDNMTAALSRVADDRAAVEPSVAEEWSHYMDQAVSNAPEPLVKLGEYLARLLDEDRWPEAERYLNAAALSVAAAIRAPSTPSTRTQDDE